MPAVGLGLVRRAHLPHLEIDAELRAREGQRAAHRLIDNVGVAVGTGFLERDTQPGDPAVADI
ncbi:hypothetical protein GS425_14145 [Rhodococcus hoagii]|nr:hypothetical protein [Prescottella equi]